MKKPSDRIDRRSLAGLEILAMAACCCGVLLLAIVAIPELGVRWDAAVTPHRVKAPWVFLWVQELLRHLPSTVAGVLLPGLFALALLIIPYVGRAGPSGGGWSPRQGSVRLALLAVALGGTALLLLRAVLR